MRAHAKDPFVSSLRGRGHALAFACFVCLLGRCAPATSHVDLTSESDRVFYVQGTSGFVRWGDWQLKKGLERGGCRAEVVAHQWHRSRPPGFFIFNRSEYELVHLAAQSLADDIVAFRQSSPDSRVYVVGQSAGCEVVRLALTALPRACAVDSVVMCAPSISPDAPRAAALGGVRGKLYALSSPFDIFILGIGTVLFGSTNRRHCLCAGLVGFHPPPNTSEEGLRRYREKLVNVRWRPAYLAHGYFGDHVTGQSPGFVANFMLLMLASREPGEAAQ